MEKLIVSQTVYDIAMKKYGEQYCRENFIISGKVSEKIKPFNHIKQGKYLIGEKEYFFRSKMEANVALYIDFLKRTTGDPVEWWYERDTFVFEKIKFGTRSFKIDFTLQKKNGELEYWEVKGYMDAKSKTKLNRMRIYYPEVKVVLVDQDYYKAIQKHGKLLNFY